MQDKEILKIIQAVVDYGWPFQRYYISGNDGKLWKTEEKNQSIFTLLKMLSVQAPVRLDPDHPHDWPIEKREGMPVWALWEFGIPDIDPDNEWKYYGDLRDIEQIGQYEHAGLKYTVAPNPLNPDEPPPSDWSPERRRVLE